MKNCKHGTCLRYRNYEININTENTNKNNDKLPLLSIIICLFCIIGFACGIGLYEDYNKTYGIILSVCIAPALIYYYYIISKWILTRYIYQ